MALKDLPADARPREKLLARGPGALSDTELIALLLRTGTKGRDVFQMAAEVLKRFDGLAGLLHAHGEDLKEIKGLGGTAKRAELLAVLELAKRAAAAAEGTRRVRLARSREELSAAASGAAPARKCLPCSSSMPRTGWS